LNDKNEHSQVSYEIPSFPFETTQKQGNEQKPDLIIIGCSQVGKEEQTLIDQLLADQYHLLVVSTFLSRQMMRALFLQGVDDVADKPYNPDSLVDMVEDTLQSILARDG
jgi:DNA-binding response OmpR family regulator